MKRTFAALLSCAALVTASVGTPPPTAQADVIADWNMQLVVMDTSWSELFTTNFLVCKDLAGYVHVSVQPGVAWSVSGEITGAGSTTVLGRFAAHGIGPTTDPQPLPGVSMCQHFAGPIGAGLAPPLRYGAILPEPAVASASEPQSPVTTHLAGLPLRLLSSSSTVELGRRSTSIEAFTTGVGPTTSPSSSLAYRCASTSTARCAPDHEYVATGTAPSPQRYAGTAIRSPVHHRADEVRGQLQA